MTQAHNAGRKQMRQMSVTVGLIILNEFVMFAISDTHQLIRNRQGWSYAFVLNLNKGLLDIIILLFTQHELKSLIMASLCAKKTVPKNIFVATATTPKKGP